MMMDSKKKGLGLIVLLIGTLNFGQTTSIEKVDMSRYRCEDDLCHYFFRATGSYGDMEKQIFIVRVVQAQHSTQRINEQELFEICDDVVRNYNSFWRRYYNDYYESDPTYENWIEAIGGTGLSIITEIIIPGDPSVFYNEQETLVLVGNAEIGDNLQKRRVKFLYEYGTFNLSKSIKESREYFLED